MSCSNPRRNVSSSVCPPGCCTDHDVRYNKCGCDDKDYTGAIVAFSVVFVILVLIILAARTEQVRVCNKVYTLAGVNGAKLRNMPPFFFIIVFMSQLVRGVRCTSASD